VSTPETKLSRMLERGSGLMLESRLRDALADSHSAAEAGLPRPLAALDLPLGLDRLVTPQRLRDFRRAAVLVPLMRRPGGLQVLLTRRADHLRNHSGQISFPGGRVEEADAHAAATALREAHEEVGLAPESVDVVGYLDDYPVLTRFVVTPVVGLVEDVSELVPDHNEVAEIFEVPLAHMLEPRRFRRRFLTREGFRVPFMELEYENRIIWGATAGMLWNLVNKLNPDRD
jgi:8-oxo-dGTP pyrophosphatase MutT (NUDIX family)